MSGAERRPRLAFITQWFRPDRNGPILWTAQALQDQGFDVGVLTSGTRDVVPAPAHNPLNDWYVDRDGDPRALYVPAYRRYDKSPLRRIGALTSFALTSTVLGQSALHDADVCLVYGSPATAALPAIVANLRSGLPYVMVVQDLWPDSIFATGYASNDAKGKAVTGLLNPFLDLAYRRAHHIVAITPGMRDVLIERGVPAEKVSVIYNWVEERVYRPLPASGALRSALGLEERDRILIYTGNLGPAQALDNVVRAVAQLPQETPLHLVLLGGGTEREAIARLATELGAESRVHLLDPVPSEEVSDVVAGADAALVSLADEEVFSVTLPSKTQSALAQSKPILAVGRGDLARIVAEAGAGWVSPPEDPAALAAVLAELAATPRSDLMARGAAGHAFYEATMSRSAGSRALGRIMRDALQGSPER